MIQDITRQSNGTFVGIALTEEEVRQAGREFKEAWSSFELDLIELQPIGIQAYQLTLIP